MIDEMELDNDCMCELFLTDPMEFYNALFWAIAANYPKYVNPFLQRYEAESDSQGGSTLASSPVGQVTV